MSANGKDAEPGRGEISPEDREAFRKRSADLGSRLDQAKARETPARDNDARRSSAMGEAFKIAIELVVGVVAGGAIGWYLDRWVGKPPWLMIVFSILGFAAGLLNVVRAARRMQAEAEPLQRAAPSVRDQDDE